MKRLQMLHYQHLVANIDDNEAFDPLIVVRCVATETPQKLSSVYVSSRSVENLVIQRFAGPIKVRWNYASPPFLEDTIYITYSVELNRIIIVSRQQGTLSSASLGG